jgi:S1-C subfamily serine protease
MKTSAKLVALVAMAGAVSIASPLAARVPASPTPAAAPAKPGSSPAKSALLSRRESVAQATVTIPAKWCAGFVAQEKTWVVTAAHCIPEGRERFDVKLRDGTVLESSLAHLDREHDLAALRLDQPAPVVPLVLGERLPAQGAQVLFVGRVDRRSRAQVATIERIDQCPSLPDVSNALFTSLDARPGDSGAPVVDRDLKVVGVIHGGARCHISAPTVGLARELTALGSSPAPIAPVNPPAAPDPGVDQSADERVLKRYKAGPFVLEKIPNGFKFRFSFRWGSEK